MQFDTEPSETPEVSSVHVSSNSQPVTLASSKHCFASQTKCMKNTYGCFRHGKCEESTRQAGCWQCSCESTKDNYGIETFWTGAMCQKADVSIEFWMFVGVTIVIVLAVGGGLVMLVGVGNEPLPGVLGAGVVKSK